MCEKIKKCAAVRLALNSVNAADGKEGKFKEPIKVMGRLKEGPIKVYCSQSQQKCQTTFSVYDAIMRRQSVSHIESHIEFMALFIRGLVTTQTHRWVCQSSGGVPA